jgi:hypothetical protein
MRFISDGPSIPDLLLERRDQGRVVFLCGAGVSINSGMPTFEALTQSVMDYFDPPESSELSKAFQPWKDKSDLPKTPLDQIFHLLHQEYGREDVNTLVTKRLQNGSLPQDSNKNHQTISKLSANLEGKAQIVTTNFDKLFEHNFETPANEIHEPPALPNIELGVPVLGITYLHGRLQESDSNNHPYILSSADFGRAYLSEGWATNFIQSLLKTYTVVLVGYQAEDPPVKYLLQGLNHDGRSDRSNLYVFDKGKPEEIEAKWRDKGVTSIAYEEHNLLWETLEAWAERAVNPRTWRLNIMKLSMKGPRQLSPHQRGQVTHLARTTAGAKLFATIDPPPPAEWLCVFDGYCRLAKESKGYGENAETFNPFDAYALDDDSIRVIDTTIHTQRKIHDEIFEWHRGDSNPTSSHHLSNRKQAGFEDIPPRLSKLIIWISKHLNAPITAWWVCRLHEIHPNFLRRLKWQLSNETDLDPLARNCWNLILEYHSGSRESTGNTNWYALKNRIESEGWNNSVIRDFESTTSPALSCSSPNGLYNSKPPLESWEDTKQNEIANWEVKFPDQLNTEIKIENESLAAVFNIVQSHTYRTIGHLEDLNIKFSKQINCYPDRECHGSFYGEIVIFKLFISLFSKLAIHQPDKARSYAKNWPSEDYHLGAAKLFAMNNVDLFKGNEVANLLLTISNNFFWRSESCREILFLIHDRWEHFTQSEQQDILDRLLAGPDKERTEHEDKRLEMNKQQICTYLTWLTIQGITLPTKYTQTLSRMTTELESWNDSWAASLTDESGSQVRSVSVDESCESLADLPVTEIINQAQQDSERDFFSFTERRPFSGLVKINPRKALNALSIKAKEGKYPVELWSALLQEWPEDVSVRLYDTFLGRLKRLPSEVIQKIQHPIGRWIENKLPTAIKISQALTWSTYDNLVSGLCSDNGKATTSALGHVTIGGVAVQTSRKTYNQALNAPIGEATQGLLKALDLLDLDFDQGIPEYFSDRLVTLINSPGEGGDHAISVLTHHIVWLYSIDNGWVMERIVPLFSFNHKHSEAAWNGYLSSARFTTKEVGTKLKPLLVKIFPQIYNWAWDKRLSTIACQIIMELAVFHFDKPDGVTHKEARACLRNMNDFNRQSAINRLGIIANREPDGWSKHIIPFIEEVWPREKIFRTSKLVSAWTSLLTRSGNKFPDALQVVKKFLTPIEDQGHSLYELNQTNNSEKCIASQFPESTLELLNCVTPNNGANIQYDLEAILLSIEESEPSLIQDNRYIRLIDIVDNF